MRKEHIKKFRDVVEKVKEDFLKEPNSEIDDFGFQLTFTDSPRIIIVDERHGKNREGVVPEDNVVYYTG